MGINLPGHASEKEQMEFNRAGVIAEEMGVPYINLMHENLIVADEDCFDWNGHLNTEGASKVTAYLGRYLTENYALSDRRGQSGYAHWDENLAPYEAYRAAVWQQ